MSLSFCHWRALFFALTFFTLVTADADAQSPVITAAPAQVAAGPDFATDVLANPWDFSDAFDLSPFPDEFPGWTISNSTARTVGRNAFLSSGQFIARTTPGGQNLVPLLFRGGADFITSRHENSGSFDHKAIPTGRYGKLAVSMSLNAPVATNSQLSAYWFTTPYGGPNPGAYGVAFRVPQAGRHIYIVDLATGIWTDARGNPAGPTFLPIGGMSAVSWTGTSLMRGLQLRPTSDGNAQVEVSIDWVRLTQRDGQSGAATLPLTFSGCAGRDYVVEVLASEQWDVIHVGTAGSGSTTTANVNYGVLPPGGWNFRVTCYPINRTPSGGTGVSSASVSITINAPPIISVHNPDAAGGADYATTVWSNAWDMTSLSDIQQMYGVVNPAIVSDGVTSSFQATATSTGDPAIVLAYNRTIDTSRFRNLTFALTLDTPFGLGGPGEGSVARVFWERAAGVTISQDILVWPGRNLYTIDLSTITGSLLESECRPACAQLPWTSDSVRYFRIDPHESTLGVTFRLGPVLLTTPDEVALGSEFAIDYSFSDADFTSSTYQARFYLDSDLDPGAKTLIDTVSGITPGRLETYRFNPSARGVPVGEYYLFVEVVETRGSITDLRGQYASGTLRVISGSGGTGAPGSPALRAVQTASNPVTIAWSAGAGAAPTSYTVAAGTSPGASNLLVANVGLQTQISGNAPPGVPIYVRIVAANAAGTATSNEISVTVGASSGAPGQPLMAPASVSGRTVALSWSPGAGGTPSGYVIVARFPGNPTVIATFPTNQTSAVFNSVPIGTYSVSVVAVNGAGSSPESSPITVTVR